MAERDTSADGVVILVGAGPGDPDLITLRGVEALRRADVVVHDSLAAAELLEWAPARAERIDVGKRGHDAPTRDQNEINALLVARARTGRVVVRLKGGDPYVYGRGGEEASACRAAGVRVQMIPGVSSAFAAAAAAGIPVTDRRHAASVAIVTGHRDRERPWTSVDWKRLALGADTIVVLMGMRNLEKIVTTLIECGRAPDTPAAVIMEGATPRQEVVEAPLQALPAAVRNAGLRAPAVIVVGDVTRLRSELAEFSPDDSRPLAGRSVLMTRPATPDDQMARALRDAGAQVEHLPMIEIVEAPASAAIDTIFAQAERYEAWFFTSRNAVAMAEQHLIRLHHSPGALGAPALCVGPATAAVARRVGFRDVRVPDTSSDASHLAEWWLEQGDRRGVHGLFPRAAGARDALPVRLRQAGVELEEVVLYSTRPALPSKARMQNAVAVDAVFFASPSAAHAFAAAGGRRGRAAFAAIGQRTAAALTEEGLAPEIIAARPEPASLVESLRCHFSERLGGERGSG